MTVYPGALDSDTEIIRVDDNITELGSQAINSLRDAVFSIEATLGINPQGSLSSLADRINVSFNANGSLKASALTSIGLATLPIVNNQVATNAGILESKLTLDFGTANLHTLIVANETLINSIAAFATVIDSDLLAHIAGATLLTDGSTKGRHVGSQIDINAVPSDIRDPSFIWTGLLDKNGTLRTAANVGSALLQINNDLTSHENAILDAHPATAITVDSSNFLELPDTITNAQEAFDEIDNSQSKLFRPHRENLHANGINRTARSIISDGYNQLIVPATAVETYLVRPPSTGPTDSVINGDDVIRFVTDNTNFTFDSYFSQVRVGDMITVNYGRHGLLATFPIESIRFLQGVEWVIRINGVNLCDTDGYAFAQINRPLFDTNTYGVLACAAANNDIDSTIMGSVIVANPKAASTLGLSFNATKFDSTHYNLWLQFYPTGNPLDKIVNLPAIDVTGNAGATPGQYTLDGIIQTVNDSFRAAGFNYRMIAFSTNGEFGLSVADPHGKASFSIVNGTISGATLTTGSFVNNVIGDASDGVDPFGFGKNGTGIASPSWQNTYTGSAAAQLPTKIIVPLSKRNYDVNGIERDSFDETFLATGDGYWPATITQRVVTGTTVETTYTVQLNLEQAWLKAGKTIVVQPVVNLTNPTYHDEDYGRFIIKDVGFTATCGLALGTTVITVVNGVYSSGLPTGFSSGAGLNVNLYFSSDSIGFDINNLVDTSASETLYLRYHELCIDSNGHTFSHERARLLKQSLTTSLLDTTSYWQVQSVSPKLRGYIDETTSSLNKYIRFYVLNFDSISGEFDGYLGKRDPLSDNISKTGAVVRTRKNVKTKFYDETNIDYIELEFVDTTTSPGNTIVTPRYADIQLFQSLQLDDEFMLIGTCVLDVNRIKNIRDVRQFGNVSEKNLTNSAINFIQSGDRYLHENGVIRGFDVQGIDSSNNKLLNLSGGIAVVNGVICTRNNGSIEIPEIYPFGTTKPQNVTWGICVNETNQFYPIIITSTKTQFFANGNYYVESVTFQELINSRKDLTLVAMVNATISSVIINYVDARRFIQSEPLNHQLVWAGGSNIVGHFQSFEALKTWVNNYGSFTNKVSVRGTFDITSPLNFSQFTHPVVMDGENCTFNIFAAGTGIILGSNITLRNFNFVLHEIGFSIIPGGFGNTDFIANGNGILHTISNLQNVVIENCNFSTSSDYVSINRPSFININLSNALTVDRLIIRNNTFTDGTTTSYCAAISIISDNIGLDGSPPAVVSNSIIENNICNLNQGIAITSAILNGDFPILKGPGVSVSNTVIKNNNCGWISYVTTTNEVKTSVRGQNRSDGLSIINNSCFIIFNTDHTGGFLFSDKIRQTSGKVIIKDNICSWIYSYCQSILASSTALTNKGNLTISDNKLDGYNTDFWNVFGSNVPLLASTLNDNNAICVTANIGSSSTNNCIINNNVINLGGNTDLTFGYDIGIYSQVNGSIINNTISGFNVDAWGILVESKAGAIQLNVSKNIINKGLNNISAFIEIDYQSGMITGFCTENIFSDITIDGSSFSTIQTNYDGLNNLIIVERNVGQHVSITIQGTQGIVGGIGSAFIIRAYDATYTALSSQNAVLTSIGDSNSPAWGGFNPFGLVRNQTLQIIYDRTGTSTKWIVPLINLIPSNTLIETVSVTAVCNEALSGTSKIQFGLVSNDINPAYTVIDMDFSSGAVGGPYVPNTPITSSYSPTDTLGNSSVNSFRNNLIFCLQNVTDSLVDTALYTIQNVSITYRW